MGFISKIKRFKSAIRFGGYNEIKISKIDYAHCLDGKNILITGASGGIGYEIAKKGCSCGASVIITGRNEEKLKKAKETIGTSIDYLQWDITDIDSLKNKLEIVLLMFDGKIDCLVNNAGLQPHEFFPNVSEKEWNVIYDTFTTAAHKIAELINNFFSPDDLDYESISNAISNFVNTIVDSLYILITETEWGEIGESLGKTLSDAWITIDWSKAGETIGEYFKAFFDFVGKAIEAVDWWAVGESVEAFLCGIDWAGVADSFFEAIGAVFGGFSAFFGGLLTDGIHSALNFFGDKIEEAGGNVVEGILVGIAEALVGIGEWIKIHVFNPFFNGFKKAFQIHSPSKVMIEMGGYIVSGLLEGLKEKWKNVVNWITDKINWLKDKLSGIAGKVTSAFTGGGNSNAKTNKRSALFSTPAVSTPYAANPAFAALSTTPIPKLATGAVIPANKEFLAVLGDQKHGTNIEAPLEMIKQANKEGLLEILNQLGLPSGGGGQEINLNLTVECDGHQLLHLMQKLNREYFKQTGRNAFIY